MKTRIVAVLITLFGAGFCLVRSYSVEPRTAQLSGWIHGEDGWGNFGGNFGDTLLNSFPLLTPKPML
jgi:hypothetical protein